MPILRNQAVHVTVIATILVMMPVFASVQAQVKSTPYTKDAVYIEGFGNGGLYTLNYDHRFANDLSVRAGFSALWLGRGIGTNGLGIFAFPLTVNYLLGGNGYYLELGWGLVPAIGVASWTLFGQTSTASQAVILGTGIVGYRYQPVKSGMIFRIDFTPLFNLKGFAPWGGISMGYAF